jgi:parallel beta-helix repeat protein
MFGIQNLSIGIWANGEFTGTEVRGNHFSDQDTGIRANGVANLSISGNNTFSNVSQFGIHATSVVRGLVIANNSFDQPAGATAIAVGGVRNAVIGGTTPAEGNRITGGQRGIYAYSTSTGTVLQNNSITNVAESGIFLASAQGGAVRANQISGPGQYGIRVISSANAVVGGAGDLGNLVAGTVNGGSASGILTGTTFTGNHFTGNTYGLQLADARNLTVTADRVTGFSHSGVYATGGSAGTVIASMAITGDGAANSVHGVFLSGTNGITVGPDNTISDLHTGIRRLGSQTGSTINGNTIQRVVIGVRLG